MRNPWISIAQYEYFGAPPQQCRRRAALRGKALLTNIIVGHGVKAIVEFVRQGGYDLLMVGYTGRSRIDDHIWGGTSQNLTRLAACGVPVVK